MNKQLKLVDFETAKLLKEKGFDLPTLYAYKYWVHGDIVKSIQEPKNMLDYIITYESKEELHFGINHNSFTGNCMNVSAPTQALVVKWLRELHGIDIDSWSNQEGSWSYTLSMVYGKILKEEDNFTTFEVSEAAAIKEALKLKK